MNQAHRLLLQYAGSHPGTSTLAMLGGTTVGGIVLLNVGEIGNGLNNNNTCRDPKEKMSIEEARFIAMVKNAKESSWRENIERAAIPHDRFMLPDCPKFMGKIERLSMEIMKNQHEKIDRKLAEVDTTTTFWI